MSRVDPLPEIGMLDRYGRRLEQMRVRTAQAESFEEAMASIQSGALGARVELESIQAQVKLRDSVLKTVLGG